MFAPVQTFKSKGKSFHNLDPINDKPFTFILTRRYLLPYSRKFIMSMRYGLDAIRKNDTLVVICVQ